MPYTTTKTVLRYHTYQPTLHGESQRGNENEEENEKGKVTPLQKGQRRRCEERKKLRHSPNQVHFHQPNTP